MSMRRILAASVLALALAAGAARAQDAGLGKPLTESDIKQWDIAVLPDGTNLPPGQGTAAEGAKLFAEKGCIACHGEGAKGGKNMALVGSPPIDRIEATKTIANFWANATTAVTAPAKNGMRQPHARSSASSRNCCRTTTSATARS